MAAVLASHTALPSFIQYIHQKYQGSCNQVAIPNSQALAGEDGSRRTAGTRYTTASEPISARMATFS